MASLIFNNFFLAWANGDITLDVDTFRRSLHTASYTENKDTHTHFDDVTNQVTGTGYTAGGEITSVSIALDDATDRLNITFGANSWPASTLTMRKSVVRKARGGAASADELVLVNDQGTDRVTSAGTLSHEADILRIQN